MPFLLKNGPISNKVEKGHILPLNDALYQVVPLDLLAHLFLISKILVALEDVLVLRALFVVVVRSPSCDISLTSLSCDNRHTRVYLW